MRVSELIEALSRLRDKHGDLEVMSIADGVSGTTVPYRTVDNKIAIDTEDGYYRDVNEHPEDKEASE
jgi:hypothetical protein